MTEKLVVKNLYKVFGTRPERAFELLRQGLDKEEIYKQTGLVIGVDDASFSVEEGEIFVVMGLSGSGKSTLVRLLNRLIEPTAGQVIVDGQDVAKLAPHDLIALRRRNMAMVFQSFALMPHLTVLDNAAFGLDIAGMNRKDARRRAQESLERVGLGAFLHSYPDELSGGMQQRVGLARALATDPSVILMDEAFSALDPLIRTEMQDELLRLQKEHSRTIVFISHDLDEALRIGSRIAIMRHGRVVQVGTPEEILRNPADDYVRAFFKGVDITRFLSASDLLGDEPHMPMLNITSSASSLDSALHTLRQHKHEYGYVHDADGRYLGVVSIPSLLDAVERSERDVHAAFLEAGEAVDESTHINELLGRAANQPFPLPVVGADGRYRGTISKSALLHKLCDAR
ncbi:glycine betaine/L-proline ABC transporter ATP-binding protein ProV [Plasticicumulans acidivorans]|nr:glycine betaine/L-proline ABC transporter ATP-binding protein ProV [Plasticicumulans acidivorans]